MFTNIFVNANIGDIDEKEADPRGYSQDLQPKYHQFNVGVDYFLSKRTDVVAYIVYRRAAGDAKFAHV